MSFELVYHKDDGGSSPFDLRAVEIAKTSVSLRIACPYLTFSYLERIVGLASDWKLVSDVTECLTSMPAKDRSLFVSFIEENDWRIRDLPGLHAKVLIGKTSAMIGSANFTTSGMTLRTEMSVYFSETPEVAEVKTWFDKLWENGNRIDLDRLDDVILELPERHPDNRRVAVTPSGDERNAALVSLEKPPKLRQYQNAKGYYTGEGNQFCIVKGSFAKPSVAKEFKTSQPKYYKRRQKLIEDGDLAQENQFSDYKFTRDIFFGSPSEAACIVDGNSRSGSVWVNS